MQVTSRCSLALVWLVAVSGCDFDFSFDDECQQDTDCPDGQRCNTSLLTRRCKAECLSHLDCAPGQSCQKQMFDDFPLCRPGCRVHEECAEEERCSDGVCEPGCRSDLQCDNGYCDIDGFFGSYVCHEWPEPVACGEASCEAYRGVFGPWRRCCADEDRGACGFDLTEFQDQDPRLQDMDCAELMTFEIDETCPAVDIFPGCRTEDGRCGVYVGAGEQGCAVIDPA